MTKRHSTNIIKYIPPYLRNKKKNKIYDEGGYFPTKKSALSYAGQIKTHIYHKDRLNCVKFLIRNLPKKKLLILDFGCGDGLEFKKLRLKTEKYIGIDSSPFMIELANKNLSNFKKELIHGGVEKLKKIKSNSIDLFTSFNVIGYLKEKELNIFFKEVYRILKKKSYFATTNGNELFDLFALNYHTKQFFIKNFNQTEKNMNSLLKKNSFSKHVLGKRFNPLEFSERLNDKYNLKIVETSFASLHKYSPEIGKILHKSKKSKNKYYTNSRHQQLLSRNFKINPNKFSFKDKWKCYFLCSVFGMLFQK